MEKSPEVRDPLRLLAPELRRLPTRPLPSWLEPMTATLSADPPPRRGWIFEPKLDGVRCLAFAAGGRVRLVSRNRKSLDGAYPELVAALAGRVRHDVILDGEVVAFRDGVTSFSELQKRIGLRDPEEARRSGVAVFYYLFDILQLGRYDLTPLGVVRRKEVLRSAVAFGGPIRFAEHRTRGGEAFLADACRRGWEGLIAKRSDAPYAHRRSEDWLKLKCVNAQEFVIVGFTDPQRSRVGLGALLVGYYQDGELRYAGKVGTGYDRATLLALRRRLEPLERKTPAAAGPDLPRGAGVHWVRPALVAQIGFSEWTHLGILRHPRFLGLRTDKAPREVVRERPRGTAH